MCNGCGQEPCEISGVRFFSGDGRPLPPEIIAWQQGVEYKPKAKPRRLSLWRRIVNTLIQQRPTEEGV